MLCVSRKCWQRASVSAVLPDPTGLSAADQVGLHYPAPCTGRAAHPPMPTVNVRSVQSRPV